MLRTQLYTRINADTGFTWGRTEPGWDDRKPERPRLMSKWIEFAFGVSSPEALMAHRVMWPLDMLQEFLVGQRMAVPATGARGRRHRVVPVVSPISPRTGGGGRRRAGLAVARVQRVLDAADGSRWYTVVGADHLPVAPVAEVHRVPA